MPSVCIRKHEFAQDPAAIAAKLEKTFGFPFFVKPANAGSSVGVHKVKSADSIRASLEDAFSFDLKIIAQQAIDARELEVSVLGNEEPRASIVGEIVPRHEFYSYEAKYIDENGAELKSRLKICPPMSVNKRALGPYLRFKPLSVRARESGLLSRPKFS